MCFVIFIRSWFQIHLVNNSTAYIYENVTVSDTGGSVLRDIFFDEELEQLTIGTSSDRGSQVGYSMRAPYQWVKTFHEWVK